MVRPLSSSSDIGLPADVFTGNSYYDVLIPDSSVSSAVFGLDSQPRLVRSFSSSSKIGLLADVFIGNSNYDFLLGDTSLPLNRGPVSNLQRNGENRGERENHRRVAPFVLEGQKWGAGSSSLTRLFVQMDFTVVLSFFCLKSASF